MMSLTLKDLVLNDRARPSRNKNYQLFEESIGKKLLFSYHMVNSIAEDIERAGLTQCTVSRDGEKFHISINDPSLSYRMQAWLNPEEFEVLKLKYPQLENCLI